MVDASVLGTDVERRGGSSPSLVTNRVSSKAAKSEDCKSSPIRVRRFESYLTHLGLMAKLVIAARS